MNGSPDTKEAGLGQDCTVEQVITVAWGTHQTAEGTAIGVADAIPVTDQHPDTTTDQHPETATDCPVAV